MLRPERMSRVSVTGSRRVMDDVVEAVHDLNLLHVTEYDGAWEGFEPGDPAEGGDEVSEKLVTVRSLQSVLGVTEEDAGPTRIVTDEALDEELEAVREQVNELDDRRSDLEDDLREVEERIDAVEPFVDLGIDLDLLGGYDHLTVRVGEGDRDAVARALTDQPGVEAFETFEADGSDVLAVAAYPGDAGLDDALVGAEFTGLDVPADAEGSPEEYLADLEHRRQRLASELGTVEDELDDLRLEVSGFLLAAEEKLAIEAQKAEAPLTFATTENAFVAEGWIPTERYVDLAEGLHDAVGDHVEVEELERADYDEHGFATARDGIATGGAPEPEPTAAADGAGDAEARTDGGHATDRPMGSGEPPVVQDNPGSLKPFELLTQVINRPKYWELDPTVILFLTFPAMFGFMIGDVGYGLGYLGLGYLLWSRLDSDALRSLGGVTMWAGGFTVLFGLLYGEIFGLETIAAVVWGGHPPLRKGLRPANLEFAQLWLVVALLIGLLHLTIGYVFGFLNDLSHGVKDAVTENASWIVLMGGVWVWIFGGASGKAPPLMYGSGSVLDEFLGFAGFSPTVGLAGLVVAAVGFVLLVVGEGGIGVLESLNVLVNVLSYTRITAVLLAKAGMAFVVNLLFFGAYAEPTPEGAEFHFMINHGPEYILSHHSEATIMFGGLIHGGIAALLFGVVVLLIGHSLVFLLGITSAGLQGIRLEYVEFFQKFYEGGGESYEPFGYERSFTTED